MVDNLELIPLKEAAEKIGWPRWKLREMVQAGRIPYVQPAGAGGMIYFRPASLDRWLEEQERQSVNRMQVVDAETGEVAS